MISREEDIAALRWLVEAGADEAVLDAPVDRFSKPHPPLEGGSKSASAGPRDRAAGDTGGGSARRETISGRGQFPRPDPSPKNPSPFADARSRNFSTLPQGEGRGSRTLANIKPTTLAPLATDGFGSALELAAMCQSLPQLKDALDSFEGSQLKKFATNTVFADGNPESRIMLIGEAPGRDEDAAGLPFVGKAGKLLDRMMAAIGLDRSTFYIINVMPWRPPDNRNPDPAEVAMCIPFLRRHIELAQPKVLVLLGAVSARHVMGMNEGIMKIRGRWMEYRVANQMVPVLPTLHPAYLLRQPAHKRLAWRDLQSLADRLDALGLPSRE